MVVSNFIGLVGTTAGRQW